MPIDRREDYARFCKASMLPSTLAILGAHWNIAASVAIPRAVLAEVMIHYIVNLRIAKKDHFAKTVSTSTARREANGEDVI